ncbi:DUF7255 family protein [Mycobacterium aquaticum]|uniref:Uncharacterized protein n=1 Tax=Mycobacterium aquaticum TaxID=1927124 RepID=A0A1X0B7K2_9MYCO|nr:hypothetical protein [Mycobacterium aquaticum]ORA38317.1 hypothetical protein BST13_06295 [Mycobacterium aquaticum]
MRARQDALVHILGEAGYKPAATRSMRPHLKSLRPQDQQEILRLYRALGGTLDEPRLRPGPWDCVLEGGLIVELDESEHFNRYRRKTLEQAWAQRLPWCETYLRYCGQYESACSAERGWGSYWTSIATERLFGPAGPARLLEGAGSPRWKQRALYDAMRDIAAVGSGVRLARLAVYDMIGGASLAEMLDGKPVDRDALREFVDERTAQG